MPLSLSGLSTKREVVLWSYRPLTTQFIKTELDVGETGNTFSLVAAAGLCQQNMTVALLLYLFV